MQSPGTLTSLTPVPPIDPSGAASPTPSASPSPVATEIMAYGSVAGVTVRLLATLPANLGQNLDAAV